MLSPLLVDSSRPRLTDTYSNFLGNLEQGYSPGDSSQTTGRLQVALMVKLLQALLHSHSRPQPLLLPPQQDSHLGCLVPQEHQNSQ